jgi:hypothetical protein
MCFLWGTNWILIQNCEETQSLKKKCLITKQQRTVPCIRHIHSWEMDTGFLGFPLSLSKCWDGSQVPSCYCVPLTQPSRLKFIKIKLLCWQSHYNYIFKIILNLKSKFRGPLSQATTSNNSNVFTFTLLLSEGRAGEAWEPSYKMMLFPLPTIKCLQSL